MDDVAGLVLSNYDSLRFKQKLSYSNSDLVSFEKRTSFHVNGAVVSECQCTLKSFAFGRGQIFFKFGAKWLLVAVDFLVYLIGCCCFVYDSSCF